jgi:hypoxia up-regulated 1
MLLMLLYRGFPLRLLEADIIGVSEAFANLTERGAVDPVVKATVTLSESGFVSIDDAIAFGDIKDESLTGTLDTSLNNVPVFTSM